MAPRQPLPPSRTTHENDGPQAPGVNRALLAALALAAIFAAAMVMTRPQATGSSQPAPVQATAAPTAP